MKYVGVDIGGTKCAVVMGDETVEKKVRFDTAGPEETLLKIKTEVKQFCTENSIRAIGVSCGSPLDYKTGHILSPPNLPGWDNVPVVDMLRDETGIDTYLCNDANAGALAEWQYGAGRGTRNMVFLTFGTGMGAGLILNGRLYPGTTGSAGEVGHMRLRRLGPVGYGKAGSFEGFCSGGGIAQLAGGMVREVLQTGRKVSFCPSVDDIHLLTAKTVADAAKNGDELAINIYERCGEMLGEGLSIIIDLFNPQCIVMGSIYGRSGELRPDSMEQVICRETLRDSREACRIVAGSLAESIGDYAALAVARMGEELYE